jgi:hypothetical protein
MNIYKQLYFRIYDWNLKRWGSKDSPEFNALFGVSFIMVSNIFTILSIVDFLIIDIPNLFDVVPEHLIILLSLTVLLFNYFWLVYKKKYKRIINYYLNENKKMKIVKILYLWVFVILSIIIPIIIIRIQGGGFSN